ncbi:MAG: 50S ribosomal protein L24 [Bdellovibrionaceae bacterium]|nr:50S ribosomal protein L24 [Pseudobdellovibrionaceae bacterium]
MSRPAPSGTPRSFHVKRNDEVAVIRGAHKGGSGRILHILRKKMSVVIEGVNLRKKAVRPTQNNPKGGFEEREFPIHISNVRLVKAGDARVQPAESRKSKPKED